MVQEQSVGETVRDWVLAHGYVDLGLQVVVLALFLLVTLLALSGAFYWLWWLVRLCNARNVQDFTNKPIPGLRKGKAAGLELEFGEVARAEKDAIQAMGLTIEELSFRLVTAEATIKKLVQGFERFEDVSGRA